MTLKSGQVISTMGRRCSSTGSIKKGLVFPSVAFVFIFKFYFNECVVLSGLDVSTVVVYAVLFMQYFYCIGFLTLHF